MKFSRAKVSAIVKNKINGKLYSVVRELASKAIIREIDPKTQECIPDTDLEITEENAIIFRVVRDAPAAVLEGYTIEEGCLMKDGEPAMRSQGSLYLNNILSCIPGKLLLSVAGEDDTLFDIYEYRPDTDTFKCLIKDIAKDAAIGTAKSENTGLWCVNRTHVDTLPDGTDCTVYDDTELLLFGTKGTSIIHADEYMDLCGCTMFEGGDKSILVCFKPEKEANDEGIIKPLSAKTGNTSVVVLDPVQGECSEIGEVKGSVESMTWSYIHGKEGYFLKTTKELNLNFGEWTIPITAYVSRNLKGFDYVVDVYQKDSLRVFTLANENYEVIKVESEKTKDRGCIVSIAD